MSKIKQSLGKPYKFTQFVDYVTVTEKDGKERTTIRTNPKSPNLPKGIYQLYLPGFGIIYLGISEVDEGGIRDGANSRLYQHAQKLTGWMKGAVCPKNWTDLRKDMFAYGYTADNILDYVLVYYMDMRKESDFLINALETLTYNSLVSKGQCRGNTAKRTPLLDHETQMYIYNQEYLMDSAQHYITLG
jgi:hypothetical protein